MKTPLEYKIVTGFQLGTLSALAELEDQVNLHISQGWRPRGGITIFQSTNGRSVTAAREMVRGGLPLKRWREKRLKRLDVVKA